MCKCGLETETIPHFPLRCMLYSTIRNERLDNIYTFASSLTNCPYEKVFFCMDQSIFLLRQTNRVKVYNQIFEKF